MIYVLIVDDHPVMRELLRQVLEPYADLSMRTEVANGEDAIAEFGILQPAIALVDIHLPTMSGIETTKLI